MLHAEAGGRPIRFGPFDLDQRTGEVRRQGSRIRLRGQPLQVLRALLARPGQVVTRDELRHELWAEGTFVDFDSSISAAVRRLRAALDDEATVPRFVQTLPGLGYRFIGAVEPGGGDERALTPWRRWAPIVLSAGALIVAVLALLRSST